MAGGFPTLEGIQRRNQPIGSGSVAVDPSGGDVNFTGIFPSLRVDGAGAVKFTALDGTVDTWTCTDGDEIPIAVTKVWAAPATTATGLHAVFAGAH